MTDLLLTIIAMTIVHEANRVRMYGHTPEMAVAILSARGI